MYAGKDMRMVQFCGAVLLTGIVQDIVMSRVVMRRLKPSCFLMPRQIQCGSSYTLHCTDHFHLSLLPLCTKSFCCSELVVPAASARSAPGPITSLPSAPLWLCCSG